MNAMNARNAMNGSQSCRKERRTVVLSTRTVLPWPIQASSVLNDDDDGLKIHPNRSTVTVLEYRTQY